MTLDQYLALDGNNATKLAADAFTTSASITRLLYGEQKPSADMVKALVEASKGKLTAHDLIFGDPRKKPEKAS